MLDDEVVIECRIREGNIIAGLTYFDKQPRSLKKPDIDDESLLHMLAEGCGWRDKDILLSELQTYFSSVR